MNLKKMAPIIQNEEALAMAVMALVEFDYKYDRNTGSYSIRGESSRWLTSREKELVPDYSNLTLLLGNPNSEYFGTRVSIEEEMYYGAIRQSRYFNFIRTSTNTWEYQSVSQEHLNFPPEDNFVPPNQEVPEIMSESFNNLFDKFIKDQMMEKPVALIQFEIEEQEKKQEDEKEVPNAEEENADEKEVRKINNVNDLIHRLILFARVIFSKDKIYWNVDNETGTIQDDGITFQLSAYNMTILDGNNSFSIEKDQSKFILVQFPQEFEPTSSEYFEMERDSNVGYIIPKFVSLYMSEVYSVFLEALYPDLPQLVKSDDEDNDTSAEPIKENTQDKPQVVDLEVFRNKFITFQSKYLKKFYNEFCEEVDEDDADAIKLEAELFGRTLIDQWYQEIFNDSSITTEEKKDRKHFLAQLKANNVAQHGDLRSQLIQYGRYELMRLSKDLIEKWGRDVVARWWNDYKGPEIDF